MKQTTLHKAAYPGLHVAIIMDGNGRWARQRGLARHEGHRAGELAVRRVVEVAPAFGVGTLSLYAFSGDNWQRPPAEIANLMGIFERYLLSESQTCADQGICISLIGRRDRLSPSLNLAARQAEALTAGGRTMHLRIALDYSAREAILQAALRLRSLDSKGEPSQEDFARLLAEADLSRAPVPDVDLVIRTGGEQRLSDFMLWESAYAELFFSRKMWPDFTPADFAAAIGDFRSRERRFGRISEAAAS